MLVLKNVKQWNKEKVAKGSTVTGCDFSTYSVAYTLHISSNSQLTGLEIHQKRAKSAYWQFSSTKALLSHGWDNWGRPRDL